MCNNEYIYEFYNQVCKTLDGSYKIVLEPGRNIKEDWIEYDCINWKMEDKIKNFVDKLKLNKDIGLEDKILKVYEFICLNYIYDVNVLYFFRKDTSDPDNPKYIAVDWYGRIIGQEWTQKRKIHNRRICYEFSRFYAKAINTLIDNKYDLEAIILGDTDNTHYVVGLVGEKYNLILDQDNFNSIKDLTRLKMGLTIEGIQILKDEKNEFKNALDKFNKNRPIELKEIEEARNKYKEKNPIEYFNISIEALKKYNIDAQGIFEYMRALIEDCDIEINKIWKEDLKNEEKRYERCLYFEYDNKTFLMDSIEKTLSIIDLDNLDKNIFILNSEDHEYKYYGG